eukprot:2429559-Prymnesium_polylepis.1
MYTARLRSALDALKRARCHETSKPATFRTFAFSFSRLVLSDPSTSCEPTVHVTPSAAAASSACRTFLRTVPAVLALDSARFATPTLRW